MSRPLVYKLDIPGDLKGTKLYYFGFSEQPKFLPEHGRGFGGLKHILELLTQRFKRFTLTFTPNTDSITKEGRLFRIKMSASTVRRMGARSWEEGRSLKVRLAKQLLAEAFPTYFSDFTAARSYERGMFSDVLTPSFDPRLLTANDRKALTKFVTGSALSSARSLDMETAYETVRDAQLIYLKRLIEEFDAAIALNHDEAWWQTYFSKNILYFQDSYIKRLEKLNLIVAGTQFPDFAVVTSDEYLDILEIKKPTTALLNEDTSRHNYYWTTEVSKAISQVENYIDNVTKNGDSIRSKVRDDHGIELRIIKPRGIIVAGSTATFAGKQKMADDFRRLNECLKNVEIIPYDELSQRLKNTVESIERLATKSQEPKKKATGRRSRKTRQNENHE